MIEGQKSGHRSAESTGSTKSLLNGGFELMSLRSMQFFQGSLCAHLSCQQIISNEPDVAE